MKTLKLVPSTPDFKFVRYNRRAFVVSSVLIIGSLVAFLMQGLNFGIDFKGGYWLKSALPSRLILAICAAVCRRLNWARCKFSNSAHRRMF